MSENKKEGSIYELDGRVKLSKALPLGIQHVLAMFLGNITPLLIVCGALEMDSSSKTMLIQNSMFIAGIATLIQLYPIWKIGSRLPIVMSVSFNFVAILTYVGATYGYASAMGAVLIGGLIEGCLGLLARYWKKIITPIVAASVVTSIDFSLFSVGTRSFGGGYSESFGSTENLLLGILYKLDALRRDVDRFLVK